MTKEKTEFRCVRCFEPLYEEEATCPRCGNAISSDQQPPEIAPNPTIAIVLFLLFCMPVGLWMMWSNCDWPKWAKWSVTGVYIGVPVLLSLVSAFGGVW